MGLQISKRRGYTHPVSGGVSNPHRVQKPLFLVKCSPFLGARTHCQECKNQVQIPVEGVWGAKTTASGCKNLLLLVQNPFFSVQKSPLRMNSCVLFGTKRFASLSRLLLAPLKERKSLQARRCRSASKSVQKPVKISPVFAPIFLVFAPIFSSFCAEFSCFFFFSLGAKTSENFTCFCTVFFQFLHRFFLFFFTLRAKTSEHFTCFCTDFFCLAPKRGNKWGNEGRTSGATRGEPAGQRREN